MSAALAEAFKAEERELVSFRVDGQDFCVDIMAVREIRGWTPATILPHAPSYILGVINLRGAVVPVIDLSCRFGGQTTQVGRRTCIVIVELQQDDQQYDIGVMVDAVSEVLEIGRADIEPPPAFGARIRTDFIAGMGKVNGKFVIILNIARVLSVEEIALLAQASESDPGSTVVTN